MQDGVDGVVVVGRGRPTDLGLFGASVVIIAALFFLFLLHFLQLFKNRNVGSCPMKHWPIWDRSVQPQAQAQVHSHPLPGVLILPSRVP